MCLKHHLKASFPNPQRIYVIYLMWLLEGVPYQGSAHMTKLGHIGLFWISVEPYQRERNLISHNECQSVFVSYNKIWLRNIDMNWCNVPKIQWDIFHQIMSEWPRWVTTEDAISCYQKLACNYKDTSWAWAVPSSGPAYGSLVCFRYVRGGGANHTVIRSATNDKHCPII